jgi:N-glycosylase/DNA lyase
VGDIVFKIRQAGDRIEYEHAGTQFVKHYIGLEADLSQIYIEIDRDPNIHAAITAFKGLRIVNQDPWECLISYICATYKNIPAIEQMLDNLCRKFGKLVNFENRIFHAFPTAQTLSRAGISDLAKCGLGYRTKYVSETARRVSENKIDFSQLMRLDYETAKKELMQLSGVGPKVADCVLLFSFGKTEAFPVDIWIKRMMLKHYAVHFSKDFVEKAASQNSISPSEYRVMNSSGRQYFGRYAGYAQEYLYHYVRLKTRNSAMKS